MSSKPDWVVAAEKKALPEPFIERLHASDSVTEEEKEKIVDAVKVAADVSDPRIPPSAGLVDLPPDELPVVGVHYVTWGDGSLSMTKKYPVLRGASTTERDYVVRMGEEAQYLVDHGLKDPHVGRGEFIDNIPRTRRERAEQYARWRYRGYLAQEIRSL